METTARVVFLQLFLTPSARYRITNETFRIIAAQVTVGALHALLVRRNIPKVQFSSCELSFAHKKLQNTILDGGPDAGCAPAPRRSFRGRHSFLLDSSPIAPLNSLNLVQYTPRYSTYSPKIWRRSPRYGTYVFHIKYISNNLVPKCTIYDTRATEYSTLLIDMIIVVQ